MIDLHIHTTCSSDGQYSPQELLGLASSKGITSLAFADHMDIDAVKIGRKLAPEMSLEFFSGLEISTIYENQEYHLLLYGFDPQSPGLRHFLHSNCTAIWEKASQALIILQIMGFDINRDDIKDWGKSVPTGVTFLRALLKKNAYDTRLQPYLTGAKADTPYYNFYRDFLQKDVGAAMRESLPPLKETIARFNGQGILVLAHPGPIRKDIICPLKECGLNGIEAYSSYHDQATIVYLLEMSQSLDLMVSAGSDFHGEKIKPNISLGTMGGQPCNTIMKNLRSFRR